MTGPRLTVDELARVVVQRDEELFGPDLAAGDGQLRARLAGSRCLVIGGAGSIGSATVRELVRYAPAELHVVDTDENNLVELVRSLRGDQAVPAGTDLRTSTLDYGSAPFRRDVLEGVPYDRVLNFAAVKHVRAERNVPSLLHMLDVNVCKMHDLVDLLVARGGTERFFAVSTDKAADPVNLMGASKRLMEHVVLGHPDLPATSARFANVAFSAGSLLAGWLRRLEAGQPLPVPSETWRYFVTPRESGQLCLLASTLLPARAVAVPPDSSVELRLLTDVAHDVLVALGHEPVLTTNPQEAAAVLARDDGTWPVLLSTLDTTGEKVAEKFVAEHDEHLTTGLLLQALTVPLHPRPEVDAALERLRVLVRGTGPLPTHEAVVDELRVLVPELEHAGAGLSLDDRQ